MYKANDTKHVTESKQGIFWDYTKGGDDLDVKNSVWLDWIGGETINCYIQEWKGYEQMVCGGGE